MAFGHISVKEFNEFKGDMINQIAGMKAIMDESLARKENEVFKLNATISSMQAQIDSLISAVRSKKSSTLDSPVSVEVSVSTCEVLPVTPKAKNTKGTCSPLESLCGYGTHNYKSIPIGKRAKVERIANEATEDAAREGLILTDDINPFTTYIYQDTITPEYALLIEDRLKPHLPMISDKRSAFTEYLLSEV